MTQPFSFEIKPEIARTMDRKTYYAARSYFRSVRRRLIQSGAWEEIMGKLELEIFSGPVSRYSPFREGTA